MGQVSHKALQNPPWKKYSAYPLWKTLWDFLAYSLEYSLLLLRFLLGFYELCINVSLLWNIDCILQFEQNTQCELWVLYGLYIISLCLNWWKSFSMVGILLKYVWCVLFASYEFQIHSSYPGQAKWEELELFFYVILNIYPVMNAPQYITEAICLPGVLLVTHRFEWLFKLQTFYNTGLNDF